MKSILLNTGLVTVPINTADPTDGSAGGMQYRSDLLKLRFFDNVWKNIATEDWVTANFGGGAFIQNQNAAAQANANFWISGNGSYIIKKTKLKKIRTILHTTSRTIGRVCRIDWHCN